ncbi:hypothetical protein [Cognatiyoonia sp. IB215182]|uniref:hypothetical protein n=1 Tax=Cognatiyoonia sp. IB215182 TaxID=3097353 RepID=UPI002A0F53AD|nr:hypothetical protein [Cognatiyoonia sp. IB215182]MDX8355710.1 hypothetical protein [Cognatiyoonia sp. IB215182]
MDRRDWDQIAKDAGFSPRVMRQRVQELVDTMVAQRVEATQLVFDMDGAEARMVERVADLIEKNALRIAGRLR